MKNWLFILELRYWIINIFFSVFFLFLFIFLQSLFYSTPREYISNIIFFILILVQFIFNGVNFLYFIREIYKQGAGLLLLSLFSLLLSLLVILFIWNSAFWSTDTGNFRL